MRCSSPGCGVKFGLFNWKYMCGRCGKYFCSAHSVKDQPHWHDVPAFNQAKKPEVLCPVCAEVYVEVRAAAGQIRPFSTNYKGRIPVDRDAPTVPLATPSYRDKSDAEQVLCLKAAARGYDLVFDLAFERSTDNEPSNTGDGTYRFTVWAATATAGKRRKQL